MWIQNGKDSQRFTCCRIAPRPKKTNQIQEDPPTTKIYPIYGPTFILKEDMNGTAIMEWEDHSERALLPTEVVNYCVKKVLPCVEDIELMGFTEHQQCIDGCFSRFRAHPSFFSKNNLRCNVWHDWAMFQLSENEKPIPCHIACFLDIKSVKHAGNGSGDYQIDKQGPYAVVRQFIVNPNSNSNPDSLRNPDSVSIGKRVHGKKQELDSLTRWFVVNV